MINVQGVIACAGEGRRFAESVGQPTPYPKHLELVGNKTILERSATGLIKNMPVSGVTFILHPLLAEVYLQHLREIQQTFKETPFSYINHDSAKFEDEFTFLRRTIERGVLDLSGSRVEFDVPTVVLAYGDTFVEGGNSTWLRQEMQDNLNHLSDGTNLIVGSIRSFGYRVYHLAQLQHLFSKPSRYLVDCDADYGMRFWNINTIEDLIRAKKDLGYPLTETEQSRDFHPRPGKETIEI